MSTGSRARNRLLVGSALGGLFAVSACVLADAPSPPPTLPAFRPVILESSVVPPTNRVLVTFPTSAIVPIDLIDPRATVQWRVYIDYDGAGAGRVNSGTSQYEGQSGNTRMIEIAIPPPNDLRSCHTIEFLVAYSFPGPLGDNTGPHTPDSVGADIIFWTYAPDGDVRTCTTFDAGVLGDAGLVGDGGVP